MKHLSDLYMFSQVPVRQVTLHDTHPHTETRTQWHTFIAAAAETETPFRLPSSSLAGLKIKLNIIC